MAKRARELRSVSEHIQERVPPQNLEAEVAVLGAVLQEKEALLKALEHLRPDHFYREAHQKIYAACLALFERNEPVDLITLSHELARRGELDGVGDGIYTGAAYLTYLVDTVPTAANVAYHARIVRDKAVLRVLIHVATDIVAEGYADREDVDEILDIAEQRIFEISQARVARSFVPIRGILKGAFELVEKLYERESRITGVPTGFTEFDEMTAGLQPSDLIIIAGRPSMGKTSFALNVARNVALESRTPIALFSLEMSKEQVAQRLLCAEARVNSRDLRTGFLRKEDWPKLIDAASHLSEAPIYIDDSPTLSVLDMRAKARRLKAEQNLGLVIVDYLQLIQGRWRAENRQQEIAEISRSLKAMAKELSVPVVALSQLSRRTEEREEGRPQLADLRESGALEQDADLVAFLYRPGVYRAKKDPRAEEDRTTEVIVAKQRNGPTGTVQLAFLREYAKFEPLDRYHGEPA